MVWRIDLNMVKCFKWSAELSIMLVILFKKHEHGEWLVLNYCVIVASDHWTFLFSFSWSAGRTRPRLRSWTIWPPKRRTVPGWESTSAPSRWCPASLTWVSPHQTCFTSPSSGVNEPEEHLTDRGIGVCLVTAVMFAPAGRFCKYITCFYKSFYNVDRSKLAMYFF